MKRHQSKIISGCEAALLGAIDAGAEAMFGYPITPASEILEGWIKESESNHNLAYLQTEDETSAGFGVCGALLAGVKAFTATAGPGHVLMQDPVSMAENIRLPFVGIIMQRGGPSTGTVNFSQQEVNLASYGGNGEGLRIVYSASSVEEMYTLVHLAFSTAWKYKFPTFVLGDGYLGKMKTQISFPPLLNSYKATKILKEARTPTYIRNCYSSEEELGRILHQSIYDFNKNSKKICMHQCYKTKGAKKLIIAHGLVASAVKEAIDSLRDEGHKIGLFRPITLNPFDGAALRKCAKYADKIFLFESSRDQLLNIVKRELYGLSIPIEDYPKPAEGFTPDEIERIIEQ